MKLLIITKELSIKTKYEIEITTTYEDSLYKINNNNYIAIIIDSLININIRKLLNSYINKNMIKHTIIIDDIKLSSYELLDRNYQVFAIISQNNIQDLSYYIEELIKKDKLYNEQKANIYKDISDILKKMGISPEKDGFHYLRKAIYECYLNPSLLPNINNNIYPILSNTFNININSIIRSINYAIETGYTKSNYEYEEKLFSNTIDIDKGKPTTVSFISIIVDELLLLHNITYY